MKQNNIPNCLLILGCGYVGNKLAGACMQNGIKVKATVRNQEAVKALHSKGVDAIYNDNPASLPSDWLADCDALLDSIPLSYNAQRQAAQAQDQWIDTLLAKMNPLAWAGYLSATSVYADSQGEWIDETSTSFSTSPRGVERLKAEQAWLKSIAPTEVFRLTGIYGNERNILSKLFAGNYKSVAWEPAHYSNRIHVDDITAALLAAMLKPQANRTINLSDDEPCSHAEYTTELAKHIGAPAPIILSPEEATQQLSPAYLDFFRDNKRISNQKLHQDLLPELKYPSFRNAISALLRANND